MTKQDVRIAIIGAGSLSTKRIYPYIGAAGAQLVACCDLNEEMARLNASRFGGRAYSEYKEMLEREKPDAVIICIGPEMHYKLGIEVMKLGYPVYTEKPPAVSSRDALEVARVSAETGILCMTAFKKRYNAAYTRAKEWLAGFQAEDLYSISADYASRQYENHSLKRDFLFDFTVHIIDLMHYLFGDVEQVFCFAKGKDAYAVSLKFANGAVGSLNLNCGRSYKLPTEEVEISIKGGNFMTVHNSSSWKISENEQGVEWREPPTFISAGDSGMDTGHLAELIEFFAAVKEGRGCGATRSPIYEGYKTMVLYEAIRDSAATGEIIRVHYEAL
ncbi:Gfo/Idh/MocA family protein [Paenibacillus sp. PAMC21692]|uniref:Gfo/Idh/MocA family protein n=1 Tax=Paenibacillus sp. PAMC21692 TaxID=2762320 RepID=UPI00164D2BF5|nr:Gfo/Idh/MocA family oxidoreductase [Paenibacillus sp. PAMC21692]QNK57017.1 Gfo/Idh/MocA family oxidoreductase [Paenibacillus sp. PAMC21692]